MTQIIEGSYSGDGAKIAIIVGRFNHFVVDALTQGAIDCLIRHGVGTEDITIVKVPGAFEIPLAVQRAARTGNFDAIIALGAVIRGGTPHFEYVAGGAASGLSQLALSEDLPIAFGVLTVDSIEQAIERSGTKAGNKGEEAAITSLEMINVLKRLA